MDQKILALTGDVFTSMILLLTISRPPCSIFMTSYFFFFFDPDLSAFVLKPVQRLKWSYFKIYMQCMMSMVELEREREFKEIHSIDPIDQERQR